MEDVKSRSGINPCNDKDVLSGHYTWDVERKDSTINQPTIKEVRQQVAAGMVQALGSFDVPQRSIKSKITGGLHPGGASALKTDKKAEQRAEDGNFQERGSKDSAVYLGCVNTDDGCLRLQNGNRDIDDTDWAQTFIPINLPVLCTGGGGPRGGWPSSSLTSESLITIPPVEVWRCSYDLYLEPDVVKGVWNPENEEYAAVPGLQGIGQRDNKGLRRRGRGIFLRILFFPIFSIAAMLTSRGSTRVGHHVLSGHKPYNKGVARADFDIAMPSPPSFYRYSPPSRRLHGKQPEERFICQSGVVDDSKLRRACDLPKIQKYRGGNVPMIIILYQSDVPFQALADALGINRRLVISREGDKASMVEENKVVITQGIEARAD
ncbi:hypothetical protein AK812_SmicGene35958 [Symbiodinium microadriaticum]|uniref:Uncharacterized protein n=1 Tax=Symbiodinium microadriaticum TaxID=2951 RepID=A0A1Q9CK52_SYMMI|nr:hypothetical protein AK812_SmicGene35958 [Symbiodinium microadriaticum]